MAAPNIDNLVHDKDVRFVFVGGKGGVGKTTSSSALATQLAVNKRVLLVSTDPAHSLGDAFLMKFNDQPTPVPGVPNLKVMEIDPSETMKSELGSWVQLSEDAGITGDLKEKLNALQEWLVQVPGIDEATALSQAITCIESGDFDTIVFDTAPTGHTIKLLGMPDMLEVMLTKIESWQGTIWSYWEMFKGGANKNLNNAKKELATKLKKYKHDIAKVAKMLVDEKHTRFVVVCIAEYLSISESLRLLEELEVKKVKASHVIINQIVNISFSSDEVDEVMDSAVFSVELHDKVKAALGLTSARNAIQRKYINELKSAPRAKTLGIIEVPLLSREVTGPDALREFSNHLVSSVLQKRDIEMITNKGPKVELYDDFKDDDGQPAPKKAATEGPTTFDKDDVVEINGVTSKPGLNGTEGKILSAAANGRYAVSCTFEGQKTQFALKLEQLTLKQKAPVTSQSAPPAGGAGGGLPAGTSAMIEQLKEDPEMKEMLKNPRAAAALEEVQKNPGSALRYMSDPELGPLIQKILPKIMGMMGGMGGKGGKF